MKTNLEFIGKNIRYLRRERGWTLSTLAVKTGMSEVPLGRIERSVNAPSASAIYCLSKALVTFKSCGIMIFEPLQSGY